MAKSKKKQTKSKPKRSKAKSPPVTLSTIQKTLNTIVRTLNRHDKRFDQHDQRFDRHDQRFDRHDKRFDQHDRRFDQHDKRFDQHDTTLRMITEQVGKNTAAITALRDDFDKYIIPMEENIRDIQINLKEWVTPSQKKQESAISDHKGTLEIHDKKINDHEVRIDTVERKTTDL